MTTWTLEIPASYRWLNANDRLHWRPKAELTAAWRDLTRMLARSQKLPTGLEKVEIVAVAQFRNRIRRDPGNFYPTAKACIDGLVDHGLVSDDDAAHVIGPDMRLGDPLPWAKFADHGRLTLTITEVVS